MVFNSGAWLIAILEFLALKHKKNDSEMGQWRDIIFINCPIFTFIISVSEFLA